MVNLASSVPQFIPTPDYFEENLSHHIIQSVNISLFIFTRQRPLRNGNTLVTPK